MGSGLGVDLHHVPIKNVGKQLLFAILHPVVNK